MTYLITHDPCACADPHRVPHTCIACGCPYADRKPYPCTTPHDAALYLWGRYVTQHTVWQGECPYRFRCANVAFIEMILEECPVARMRPFLPCALYAGAEILVTIGEVPCGDIGTVYKDITVMGWLDHVYQGTPLMLWEQQDL